MLGVYRHFNYIVFCVYVLCLDKFFLQKLAVFEFVLSLVSISCCSESGRFPATSQGLLKLKKW